MIFSTSKIKFRRRFLIKAIKTSVFIVALILLLAGQCGGTVPPNQHKLTLNITGTGSGTVKSQTGSLECDSDCSAMFDKNTELSLIASVSANSHSRFAGWSGGCSGSEATCTLTMDVDKNVTATFTQILHTLTVTKIGNGSVSSSPSGISCGSDCTEDIAEGTKVTLTETPDRGWIFANWSANCTTATPTTCTTTMDQAKTVTAKFKKSGDLEHTLTVTKSGTGKGVVLSTPSGIDCGNDCQGRFATDSKVTLKATPLSGSGFTKWEGDCSGSNAKCTISMNAEKNVRAIFDDRVKPVIVSVSPKDNQVGVGRNPKIIIEFSKPMNKQKTQEAFETHDGSMIFDIKPLSFSWNSNATVMTISIKELDCGRDDYMLYGYKISTKAEDLAGNKLSFEKKVSFASCKTVYKQLYAEKDLDGYIYNTGNVYNHQEIINVGDINNNDFTKGFLSFDLSAIPADILGIGYARVGVYQKKVVGTPYKDLDSGDVSLGIYHVYYGESLDAADFTTPYLVPEQKSIADSATIGRKEADVLSWLEADIDNRQKQKNKSQFMLSFDINTDNQNDYDYVELSSSDETILAFKPYLELGYWVK